MRNRIVSVPAVFIALMVTPSCTWRQDQGKPVVTVTGTSEVGIVPDIVDLQLGVEVRSKDLKAAFATQEAQTKRILEIARTAGVADRDVQTGHLGIRPIYDDESRGGALQQYELQRLVGIRLHDPRQYEAVLPQCLEAGANRVFAVTFRSSKQSEYRAQAREMAVAAAREKALAMAGKLGQRVGKAVAIEEELELPWAGTPGVNIQDSRAVESAGDASGGLALGQIMVRSSVKVSFELR